MKVEIENNDIRIKGNFVGKERHIKIYCREENGEDLYMISIIKDGIERGIGPVFYMSKNHVIKQQNGIKEFVEQSWYGCVV